jgi:hypothetical protein
LPQVVAFPVTGVGLRSDPVTVTLTNTGAVTPVENLGLYVAGNFVLSGNRCGSEVAPGASCTFDVMFAPTKAEQMTGQVTVNSPSIDGGTEWVSLAGTGFDFSVKGIGQLSQAVSAGQTASFNLKIQTADNMGGTFTVECGKLPANAVCSMSAPTPVTVAAGTTGDVPLEVATGTGSAVRRDFELWRAVPLLCGLVFLPWLVRRARRRLWIAVVAAALTAGVTSCVSSGGGTGGGPPANGPGMTPAGTYSIPVNVESLGLSHSVTISLTVD